MNVINAVVTQLARNGRQTAKRSSFYEMKEFNPDDYNLVSVTTGDNETVFQGIDFEMHDSETRFFLEEHILGVLVPALEQLLIELDEKRLNTNGMGCNIKDNGNEEVGLPVRPIHWIAQYLMRHNPRHGDTIKSHPYHQLLQDHVQKMRPVIESLRAQRLREELARKQALEKQKIAEAERKMREEQERLEEHHRIQLERMMQIERESNEADEVTKDALLERERLAKEKQQQEELAAERRMEEARATKRHEIEDEMVRQEQREKEVKLQKRKEYLLTLKGRAIMVTNEQEFDSMVAHVIKGTEEEFLVGTRVHMSRGILSEEPDDTSRLVRPIAGMIDKENAKMSLVTEFSELGDNIDEDRAFVENICEILCQARKSIDIEEGIKEIKTKASNLFNTDKKSLFRDGLSRVMNWVKGSRRGYSAELDYLSNDLREMVSIDTDGNITDMEVVGEEKKEDERSLTILRADSSEMMDIVESGEPQVVDDKSTKDDDEKHFREKDEGESTVVIPLKDSDGEILGVISVDYVEWGDNLGEDNNLNDLHMLQQYSVELADALKKVDLREKLTAMGEQAVDWIQSTTKAAGVYFALVDDDNELRYVYASKGHEHMVGQTLQRGKGVTFDAVDSGEPVVIDDIGSEERIHWFNHDHKTLQNGGYMATPIKDENECVVGVIAADTIGKEDTFSNDEKSSILQTANIFTKSVSDLKRLKKKSSKDRKRRKSGGALSSARTNKSSRSSDATDSETLAIERESSTLKDKLRTKMLKKFLQNCRKDLRTLDNSVIAELVNYKTPPTAVLRVVKATLYILGHKPSEIKSWIQCRILLRDNFLKRITTFDPTLKSRPRGFARAKKLIKSMDKDTLLAKASKPATLLFSFVHVSSSLRNEAVAMRKTRKQQQQEKEQEEHEEREDDEEDADNAEDLEGEVNYDGGIKDNDDRT